MKISTEIGSAAKIIGEERAIEYFARAGFDAWDFSMFEMCKYDRKTDSLLPNAHPLAGNEWLAFARRLSRVASDCGIVCNQSHAPMPSYSRDVCSYYKRAIECTAEAGGEICIIHPDNYKSAEKNAEMYFGLLDFAKSCNVKIATENMWQWDNEKDEAVFSACATPQDFCAHLAAVDDPYFVACLDIGHAEMRGIGTSAPEMIRALGKKLCALHIHDNDQWKDLHQLPFTGKIDFNAVIRALREINYNGYFTLEADCFLDGCTSENIFAEIEKMYISAKRLADMYDSGKTE